eukprot:scaffold199764_cov22-Tisochrysis_lutea.AAC.3
MHHIHVLYHVPHMPMQGEGMLLPFRDGRALRSPGRPQSQQGLQPGNTASPRLRQPNPFNQEAPDQKVMGLKLGADGVLRHERPLELVPRSDRVACIAEHAQHTHS